MKSSLLRRAAVVLAAAALVGCAALDTQKAVAEQAEQAKKGPQTAPYRSITGFSGGLRCMDNLMLDFGTHDIATIVEDLADQTKKVNAGTKDMLISAVSDMTRRSRAVRLVAYGQDSGNTIGFLPGPVRPAATIRSSMPRNSVSACSSGTADGSRPITWNPPRRYHASWSAGVSTIGTQSMLRCGNSIPLGMIPTMA